MNTYDRSIPDPALVLDLIEAFRRSKTMFAAVELGVFDVLKSAMPLDELVLRLGCDRIALMTLLDSCVALGLLARDQNSELSSKITNRCSRDQIKRSRSACSTRPGGYGLLCVSDEQRGDS